MNDALHDLAKWVAQQQRTAFLEGAVHQATRINYDILDAIGEAARLRYPDPEPKAEPQDDNDWPHTCPSCLEWWCEFDYCAICGREAPAWRVVEKP